MADLIAYETVPACGYDLVTAPHGREWMESTHRSAYRCLPLLIANQAGWLILNPATVRATWDGGAGMAAIEIQRWQPPATIQNAGDGQGQHEAHHYVAVPGPDYCYPTSHFGSGILTWTLPYLFRTPPGYNLLVRGPANSIKDGVAPLEGLVETDWTPATFTMNWKITRTNTWITFAAGEPICMIVPQQRGQLEQFTPKIVPLADNPELQTSNAAWCTSRDQFNTQFMAGDTKQSWEKHYFQGAAPDGSAATEHQTRLHLQQFSKHA